MTTTNNTTAQKNVTRVRLIALFVLFLLSSTGAFAQNTTATVPATTPTQVLVTSENNVASMEFAVWFMGSTKSTNSTSSGGSFFSKKALINSGINTNSVLIRSLLKKVSSQENNVA